MCVFYCMIISTNLRSDRAESNFELICVTVSHLCPSPACFFFLLDFHFYYSAVHTEPHEQTDVERAEESQADSWPYMTVQDMVTEADSVALL